MDSKTFSSFENFWQDFAKLIRSRNYPTYHPCCKVWVARQQKLLRRSHQKHLTYSMVIASMASPEEEPMQSLKAHMQEHGWGLPIKLNFPCNSGPKVSIPETPPKNFEFEAKTFQTEVAFQLENLQHNQSSPRSMPTAHRMQDLAGLRPSDAPHVATDSFSMCLTCKSNTL